MMMIVYSIQLLDISRAFVLIELMQLTTRQFKKVPF